MYMILSKYISVYKEVSGFCCPILSLGRNKKLSLVTMQGFPFKQTQKQPDFLTVKSKLNIMDKNSIKDNKYKNKVKKL